MGAEGGLICVEEFSESVLAHVAMLSSLKLYRLVQLERKIDPVGLMLGAAPTAELASKPQPWCSNSAPFSSGDLQPPYPPNGG